MTATEAKKLDRLLCRVYDAIDEVYKVIETSEHKLTVVSDSIVSLDNALKQTIMEVK